MVQQIINIGTPNAGDGDTLRNGGAKINDNFDELYAAVASKADASALAAKAPLSSPAFLDVPTAPTAAANTNTNQLATTAMVQSALAAYIAAQDVLVFKGAIDCSSNPNYPAASAGFVYKVSVAGRIGGASGPRVEINDTLTCTADGSSAGNHATVGGNWIISQANIDGAVIGPASSTDARIAVFDGITGKLIKDGGATIAELTAGATNISTAVHGAAEKTTPVDADELALVDSEDSNSLKKITFARLKAWVKSWISKSDVGLGSLDAAWTSYTPTVSAQSGSFTALGTVTGTYMEIGKLVFFQVRIPITTNGSAGGSVQFTLPVAAATSSGISFLGAENFVSGKLLNVFNNSSTVCRALFYDGTYPGANGALVTASGYYQAA